ncbi:MAG: hypothetical protein L0Z07_04055, partial [Planctomycetes bacterium]|nr:hypothetical protein [Planctomycetota bacterium]
DRDTKKLDDKGSGVEEEIGLAPLDDEDVLSVHGRRKPEKPKKESDSKPVTGSNVTTKAQAAASSDVALRDSGAGSSKGSGKGKSLIEEEFHDPEKEKFHRKLAQRLEYNPLHPPGYVSAKESRGPSLVVWVGSVAIVLAIILLIVVVVNSTF